MISYKDAYKKVLDLYQDFGHEQVSLETAMGRILAEDIVADRNFPPFNRATKDGIAINYDAIEKGLTTFKIEGVLAAGMPPQPLMDASNCVEIMTGAVVPDNADTVVMYEHLFIENGSATLTKSPNRGQDIHICGSDQQKGDLVLKKYSTITASEIGVLAAVGMASIKVRSLPKVAIVSTGNELVEVEEIPLPHQIRKSNIHTLYSALSEVRIVPTKLHLADEKSSIKKALNNTLQEHNAVLLSGGVSKGKFDFLPQVLEELGVEKIFHGVFQRPGKPFWFGIQRETNTVVFSFPGNPVSTFANYNVYFKDWLRRSLGIQIPKIDVILEEAVAVKGDLTMLLRVKIRFNQGHLSASLVKENGSGDLCSLVHTDGFIILEPKTDVYEVGELVPFVPTRDLL
ncbi:molybdopterin molybdotransferase MoeA [Arenibacter palladensis]|uniref:molybdopterin molybdotransferase MoeA n=1 Tax=Arenibacter palladensis TaxID=237373 RepID=UPI0026E3B8F0|nr:molybdopterin molybdotransferase MoeA [Arenibacter palladensis]MDO6601882.1 molybdopterin molybdotransferase MoeA [Arenibacter palladensis]